MIQHTVAAGHAAGKRVSICGEMASDPLFTLVLLGLGLDALSMNAAALPMVKRVIRKSNFADAKQMAEHVLTLPTTEDIEAVVRAHAERYLGDLDQYNTTT